MDNAQSLTQKAAVRDLTRNVLISWGLLAEDKVGVIHPTNAYFFYEEKIISFRKFNVQCLKMKQGLYLLINANIKVLYGNK
ncbi:hypothetical protein HMPREF1872_00261 [Amygdalobacter nucleatus]|uniref:Uncharacterized protein n=1 Tax=Amygdalobacter nucleatus TaxID=3029274 RepID=A0A133YHB0_9FIRM|nr:hypothetical protein HMPREF1872_00261 [Amygdalobacter nucleatus]